MKNPGSTVVFVKLSQLQPLNLSTNNVRNLSVRPLNYFSFEALEAGSHPDAFDDGFF